MKSLKIALAALVGLVAVSCYNDFDTPAPQKLYTVDDMAAMGLTPISIKEVKEKELNDMQTRTREFQERAQQDYQKKQNELLAPIIDKAKSAIDKVAAAGGFLVVFDTSTGSLAYFDEATLTDVAPAVKKELGITDAPAAAPAAK